MVAQPRLATMGLDQESGGLSILNPSPIRLSGPPLLHELISRNGRYGNSAVDFLSEKGERLSISYAELHAASDQIASRMADALASLPAGNDKSQLVVPLLIPQSPELYIALLGILKSGGAFCPLNLDAPAERIKFILKDVHARIVLVSSELASKIPHTGGSCQVLFIDRFEPATNDQVSQSPPKVHRQPTKEDLAYVMYTSGSTGTPKGVGISHDAATQSLLAHDRHIPDFRRFLQFAAPTFDVSVFDIFFPLFRGCTLVSCERSRMLMDLPGILCTMDVDACELTPSVAGSLLRSRDRAPNLRLLLTIGEMLTDPLIQEFGGNLSQESILWGMYGPTEATIHCTLQPAFKKESSRTCIGIPLDTVSVFVLEYSTEDDTSTELRIVPAGQVGELAIGGFQLARGYINRPDQTAATFIESAWGRLYRTGDKARILADGTIECLGRINDTQVKLNGQRIELGEVEQAILRTNGCHGAVATVISNTLVAFAAVESPDGMHDRVLSSCKSWLPGFMIPADIKIVSSFPQLPSGKVDRKRLAAEHGASLTDKTDSEPQFETELERYLYEVGQKLLGPHITPRTQLSSVGLDSLVAIQYASTLRDSGTFVDILDILESPTILDLSRIVRKRALTKKYHTDIGNCANDHLDLVDQHSIHLRAILGTQIDEIDQIGPCTPLQTSMLIETLKDSRLYINQFELMFPPDVSALSIKSWITYIAQQNEIFRTGFIHVDNALHQVIWRQTRDQIHIVGCFNEMSVSETERFLQSPLKVEIKGPEVIEEGCRVRFTLHHSIYDGWTTDLLIEDLSTLLSGGTLHERPQFGLALRHITSISEDQLMIAKEYWAEYLRGSSPSSVPNLKTIAVQDPQIMTDTSSIHADPNEVIRQMRQSALSPQVLFQASLAWLWAAVVGRDEVILGSVSSGRSTPIAGIERIMGPFIATLPLRVSLQGCRSINELMQGIHTANRESLQHEVLSLSDVKKAAGIQQNTRLFDVIFVYQESLPSRKHSSGGVREVWHKDAVETGLLVEILPLGDRYNCQMTWHSDVYSDDQIRAFARHLDTLTKLFLHHMDEPLDAVPKHFPADGLSRYNVKPTNINSYSGLSDLVENTVLLHPSRESLSFCRTMKASSIEAETLTYYELNSGANQIARHLQKHGASPGKIIAIIMEKSTLLYRTILGILKTGCAYLPILPSTPTSRIKLILQQASPSLCLVDDHAYRLSADFSCTVLNLEDAPLSSYDNSNLGIQGDPSSLAYIIYTSGTTGTPKGVSVTNKNMLSNIEILSRIYPHSPRARMLQACSQAFDVSVFEIFFTWANGMCLCSATNDTLFEDLERAVHMFGVTHLSMTVTVASLVNPQNVPKVEFLVTSGEPMTDEVLDKWADTLYQGYGPSETTNICTVRKVARGDSSQFLGWSFENTSTFICYPDTWELVPVGCIGELCFGGDQVAVGYLKLVEMTAEKFFEHPEYGRLYRSGDLGRMLPDGSLIILGRIDTQIKLRGLRIELQEIQSTVLATGLARTCTGMLINARGSETQQLALFYVPMDHASNAFRFLELTDSVRRSNTVIQQSLQDSLPDYMVPSFIFPVTTLPLTSSGKVDSSHLRSSASSLPDDFRSACSSVLDYDQTEDEWTEAEKLIAKTLVDVLSIDPYSIRRWVPFAALGIDSISSMPLARELQKVFETRIPLSLVIQNSSVGRLAVAIASATNAAADGQVTSKEADLLPESLAQTIKERFADQEKSVNAVLPCTPLQEAMLAASLSGASASYSNHMLFQLRMPSDTISGLWAQMFRRHDILRTCFLTTDDVKFPMVQAVLDNYQPTVILYEADDSSLETEIAQHLNTLTGAVDSSKPPVSLAIIRTKDAEYLSFACHHAVYDGISMRNLLSEVEALARSESLLTPPRFEAFLRTALALPSDVDDFWAQHLQELRPLHLERTAVPNDDGEIELTAQASSLNLSSIESRLKDVGISLLSFCQATWAITVSLLQNHSDVCFGNVVSGRSIALDDIHSLVAPCFNTLPCRMNLRSCMSTLQLAKRFQSLNIDMLPYQFTGLRRIQSQLQTPSSLFDTLLIVQPHSQPLDESIWSLKRDSGAMDVPIVCELTPSKQDDTLRLHLHRQRSQFSLQALLFIRDVFQHVFQECLTYPSSHFLTSSTMPAEWQGRLASLTPTPSCTETPITTPASSDYDVNWSNEELIVRSVLSKLTKIPEERIERHMPIYRFGLDSIGAVQVASSLRRENRIITAAAIMTNPTLVGIASNMGTDGEDDETRVFDFEEFQKSVTPDLTSTTDLPHPIEAILPCSHVQQGMLSQFLTSEGRHYFNFSSWTLDASVDIDRVLHAWSRLAACHPILRTGFIPVNHTDASFAMVVYPSGAIPISVTKLYYGQTDIRQWRADSAQHALNKLHHPPWRIMFTGEDSGPGTMHLAMHHALYDAHSLRILLHDLAHLIMFEDNVIGSTVQTSLAQIMKPPASLREAEVFWKRQAENLVVNTFPTLTPLRVEQQRFSSVSKTCRASPHSLRQSVSEASVTLQAALQGAWTRILSAYHGEPSVTFGVVFDGRPTEESRRAVFPMISTLPILAQNFESNQELLQSMLQYNAAVRQFEQTPLSNIQRWVGRPDGSLFDTILVYQVTDVDGHRMPWTVLEEVASIDYTVSLEIEETSDKLLFNLTFDESILPVEQAAVLLRQFDHILVDLITRPTGNGNSFSTESSNIYSILPPLDHELPSSVALLHQFVEQTVKQKPDGIALEFVDELDSHITRRRWTYKQLDAMGNNVASILVHNSVPPKSIVAICFDKCPEAYFSILGILKAGGAFLALDPSAPSSRQEFILRDSGAACLLIARGSSTSLGFKPPVPILEIGNDTMSLKDGDPPNPALTISPSDTCYCLYTSGTTGTPKGCLISHDNAVQAMLAFKELFLGHWDVDSRWLQFASFHFDVSVLEQYWSWFVGITVVAAPRDLILSDLVRTISHLEITHIDLTPSLARLVHPNEVPSLCRGVFITGGEQLRQDVLDNWGPKEVIYNAYGPTEATIGVTMFQRVPVNGRSSNIGRLFPNVGGYVFQPGTEAPVLRGGVGELCVSGRLVGKGYLNRPDLTEQRFPTLTIYNERVYRTGDLVRVFHDGTFDFLGRADDQVKLRGQRLEIGEINNAIKVGVSQIADVATLVARHGNQDRDLLVSFVAPASQARTADGPCILSDKTSLKIATMAKDACRGRLPGYMVPTYILCITHIPLSANNKANLNELKRIFNELSPEQLRQISVGADSAHRVLSSKEQQIANVLSTITGVELASIHPSSTIFELGVDSITVTRVARSLHGAGFPHATPSLILKNAQISQLALILGQHKRSGRSSRVRQAKQSISACSRKYLGLACRTLSVAKHEIEYIAPCTPLQEGMLTRMRTTGDHSAYFNSFCFTLHPSVSAKRLQAAWTRVVNACSILRTAFIQTSEGYVQVALQGPPLRWAEVQVEGEEVERNLAARYRTWIESNQLVMQYPVELDYVKSCEGNILALRLFHAVYDAHSFGLIMGKVLDEYDQTSASGPSFLDVLPYGPLLNYSSSRGFWESSFKGHNLQPISTFTNKPSTSDISVSRIINSDNLESRRVALGVTHQTFFQAAWLAVLQQYFQAPPAIGVVFSGRSILFDDVEDVVGPMFNTLPFRVEASDITTWESLIRRVHDYNTSVLEFVHTPLRDIQKWCTGGRPLFNTLFTFDHDTSFENSEHNLWSSITSTAAADYPLALEIVLTRKGDLRANIVAQSGVADEKSLTRLLEKLQQALISLASSDNTTAVPVREELGGPLDISLATHGDSSSHDTAPSRQACASTFEWTDVAQKVRREIAQLAGLAEDDISETSSILELGLDSIDAIKLSARLPKLGIQVTTSELMRNATIKSILSSRQVNHSYTRSSQTYDYQWDKSKFELRRHLEAVGINLANVEDVLPPTPLQDSMVANMLLSDFQRYFNHDVLEIGPSTDIDRLKNAWATVYANSPILRTSFEEVDDPNMPTAFCQVVRKSELQFSPAFLELPSLDEVQTIIDQARNVAKEANGRSGLFRISFAETPSSRYAVISISHALYDGWSLDMLYQDVRDAYDGNYKPRRPYESYLSRISASPWAASRDFWTDLMQDVHPTLLPVEETPKNSKPVIYRAELRSKLTLSDIKTSCKAYSITPQALCQGSWAAVMATITTSLDVTFGAVMSGRDTEEAQELLFPTMNTVPIRALIYGTVTEYLQSLQATLSEVLEFQHVPLREVQKVSKNHSQTLFNTLFILQNLGQHRERANEPLMTSIQGSSAVEYPLCVEVELTDESAVWRIACDECLGPSNTASKILGDLDYALQYLVGNPDAEIIRFSPDSDEVRICNLRPITLRDESLRDDSISPGETPHDSEEEWRGKGSPIVYVLAKLSGVDADSINPSDSIYHLGLDSISAMKASSMLRKAGIRVSVRELLKATSIHQLLDNMSNPDGQSHVPSARDNSYLSEFDLSVLLDDIGMDLSAVEEVLPALPMQVHMLTVWQNTDGFLFFPTFKFKITGQVSPEAIQRAWEALAVELPIFRTHFVSTESPSTPFLQVVLRPENIDASAKAMCEATDSNHWALQATSTPFITLAAHGSELGEAHMYLRIHHALYDGVSLPLIMGRFAELCIADARSSPRSLDSWRRFALDHTRSDVKSKARKFWTSYLEGVTPVTQSDDFRHADIQASHVEILQKDVLDDLGRLKLLSSAHGVTLQSLFFAAYAQVSATIREHSRDVAAEDAIFGVYMANRASYPDLEEVMHPTLNILPLRVRSPASRAIISLAAEIQKDLLEVNTFEHTAAGLWEIKQWTGVKIDTFVNFLSLPDNSIQRQNVVLEESPTDQPPVGGKPSGLANTRGKWLSRNPVRDSYPDALDLEVAVRGETMDIGIFSAPYICSESQANDIIGHLVHTLEGVR